MDKTKKIKKFFETRKMSLEKNNACVQAKYPNIKKPPIAGTQASDPTSFKVEKFKVFSQKPIILGSPDAYRRVMEREQKLNNLDNRELYA